ncbi:hypothetical protein SAMN05421504_108154 [Amycolatopsis xylanica]|uniref:Uncharacterized protein n=1 Tax=Amycolatopsis xylanica TaxID=589385 RepID=A0A1H3PD04_9PSEU|nr:hypothetical protein [Amycolatopsis xylanica]SDY98986.1 hypothetical protein SAMN05421504_108154 [Amycolatopsis xylanica]
MKLFGRDRDLSFGTRLRTAAAVCVTAVAVLVPGAQPANAVTPGDVKDALQTAYDLYNKFFANQLTLEQATAQIIDAINAAKSQILAHIDALAAAEVKDCARPAVGDFADITRLTLDQKQAFAREASACVSKADNRIPLLGEAAVDEIGFALNTVGPIALIARAYSGLTNPELTATLRNANTNLVARLKPSCIAHWLWPDATPQFVEVELICTAYNGHQGFDSVIVNRRKPSPPIDFTDAINAAAAGTSYPIGVAALRQIH